MDFDTASVLEEISHVAEAITVFKFIWPKIHYALILLTAVPILKPVLGTAKSDKKMIRRKERPARRQ